MTFLRDQSLHDRTSLIQSIRESVSNSDSFKGEPEWVVEHEIKVKLEDLERREKELQERLEEIREKERLDRLREKRDEQRSMARKKIVSRTTRTTLE